MKIPSKKLQDVQLGSPIISDGTYHARLSLKQLDKERKETKSEKEIYTINIAHEILEPVTLREDGSPLKGNATVYKSIPVQNENYDYVADFAKIANALGYDLTEDFKTEDIEGKIVKVVVVYEPPRGEYKDKNKVKAWLKADDNFEIID